MRARLPYPPTVNHYYAQRRRVKCRCCGSTVTVPPSYLSKQAREFRERVVEHLADADGFGGARLAMLADIYPARGEPDFDNRLKGLCDALEHAGVFDDDKQIKDARIRVRHKVVGGAVDVELWEI